MKILVIGLGLIGGSVCKALKKYTSHEVGGFDLQKEICKRALSEGSIDRPELNTEAFKNYDMSILCINPAHVKDFIGQSVRCFAKDSIISDVCGVKTDMVQTATLLCKAHGQHYVSTHPMAGRERAGYENSHADLFLNANFITTPVEETNSEAINAVESIAKEIGFCNFNRISPQEHDKIIAYTSQLAHVVSGAYVKSPMMECEKGFTGGSYQDMTRIATMNEDMWSVLFMLNKDKLVPEIDILIENLSKYRQAIISDDISILKQLICESRQLKEKDLSNAKFPTRFD